MWILLTFYNEFLFGAIFDVVDRCVSIPFEVYLPERMIVS